MFPTEPHTCKISEMKTWLLKFYCLEIYNKCTHNLTAIAEGAIEALGPVAWLHLESWGMLYVKGLHELNDTAVKEEDGSWQKKARMELPRIKSFPLFTWLECYEMRLAGFKLRSQPCAQIGTFQRNRYTGSWCLQHGTAEQDSEVRCIHYVLYLSIN